MPCSWLHRLSNINFIVATDLWLFSVFWGQLQGTAPYPSALHTNFLLWTHARSERWSRVRRTQDALCLLWKNRRSRGPWLCHLTFPLPKSILKTATIKKNKINRMFVFQENKRKRGARRFSGLFWGVRSETQLFRNHSSLIYRLSNSRQP